MGFIPEADAKKKAATRQLILETAMRLFSEKSIDAVNLKEIGEAAGVSFMTVYRHFDKKPDLVLAVGIYAWQQFAGMIWERRDRMEERHQMTAAEELAFYLDSFLILYREHRDMLRFNQLFNIYLKAEDIKPDNAKAYRAFFDRVEEEFHAIYAKGEQDHTLRTDVPEGEMLSTTLHLMLAAVTRYAVGLVYHPEGGFHAEKELETMKDMLLWKYTFCMPQSEESGYHGGNPDGQ